MRLQLDENIPADFASAFSEAHVETVYSLGWSGVKNGELLRGAKEVFDVFVTLDRNLEFQQNIKVLSFGVVVVQSVSNRMADLVPLVEEILTAAQRVVPGTVEKAGA